MRATLACKECGMLFSFYVQGKNDGMRVVQCRHCGAVQTVYIKIKIKTVPVIVGRRDSREK